jgi:hypothetical protein
MSNEGTEGVMSQLQEGPATCSSSLQHGLFMAWRNYCIIQWETLGIIKMLKQIPFLTRTPHSLCTLCPDLDPQCQESGTDDPLSKVMRVQFFSQKSSMAESQT